MRGAVQNIICLVRSVGSAAAVSGRPQRIRRVGSNEHASLCFVVPVTLTRHCAKAETCPLGSRALSQKHRTHASFIAHPQWQRPLALAAAAAAFTLLLAAGLGREVAHHRLVVPHEALHLAHGVGVGVGVQHHVVR